MVNAKEEIHPTIALSWYSRLFGDAFWMQTVCTTVVSDTRTKGDARTCEIGVFPIMILASFAPEMTGLCFTLKNREGQFDLWTTYYLRRNLWGAYSTESQPQRSLAKK